MTRLQKTENIVTGLLMIILAVLMAAEPEFAIAVMMLFLAVSLLAAGIRYLVYYFRMARYMVSGKMILFIGVIVLDLGALTLSISGNPQVYVILYLVAVHLATGAIDVLRAFESKKAGSSWRLKLASGIANILTGVACIVFFGSVQIVAYIYCAGMFYSGCLRIASALRRSAIVYVSP